jgi:putative transposase
MGFFSQSLRSLSVDRRRGLIETDHPDLSITGQCRLLSISRSSFYYRRQPENKETLALMRVIDASFLEMPLVWQSADGPPSAAAGQNVGRRRVRRLMRKMGLSPIYQRPRTSDPNPQHRIYPYLLRHLAVERPNHVWCADITYILHPDATRLPIYGGDHGLGDAESTGLATIEHDGYCFCVMALEEALARFGAPKIVNTDQGSQFTSLPSPLCSRMPRSGSAWTAGVAGWTMCLLNACGAR